MSDIAIRVENLSKQYRLGQRQYNKTLREILTDAMYVPFRRLSQLVNGQPLIDNQQSNNSIWALKDVSFEIKRGDVVGIIGRNGAGKSTLLKILTRITEPTEGYAEIYGRVGSLLEVGTGFHSELTGRENIYLNGAILGMGKSEIERKFDEIVAFSEIEKFLDTPVKRYSSGMYVRLAFAVAAHLKPEILIVDEVLAVGDAAFQKKCLKKMEEIASEGRTVLFVSHNMGLVQTLCRRAILLLYGSVYADDTTDAAVSTYLKTLEQIASQDLLTRTQRWGKGQVRIKKIEISTDDNSSSSALATGRPACFTFHISETQPEISCSFTIYDQLGQPVTYFDSAVHSQEDFANLDGSAKFTCEVDELPLIPGRYRINAAITSKDGLQDHLEAAAFFDVEQEKVKGRPVPMHGRHGKVFLKHRWTTPK